MSSVQLALSMQTADSQEADGLKPRLPFDDYNAIKSEADSDSSEVEELQQKAPWRALFAFTTRSHVLLLVCGIISSAIAGAASPATYLVAGQLLTNFVSFGAGVINRDQFILDTTRYVLYYVGITAASWLFHSIEFTIWLAFGELQAKSARDRLFHRLLEKEIAWYDMRKDGIGALLSRIQAQIRELQLATAQPMGSLVSLISSAVLSLIQAFVKSWDLTLVTLATVPFIIFLAGLAGRGMQTNLDKQQVKLTEAQRYSSSAFSAIETVKCFNAQHIELEKYKKSMSAAAGWYVKVANAAALQMGLVTFLSQCMFVPGFYYGSLLVAQGKIPAGDVITTFFSALTAFQSLEGVLPQMIVFEKGRTAGSTLRKIMAQIQGNSATQNTCRLLRPPSCSGNIDLRNISFAYPARPDQCAIKDINLFIQGGELVFFIGKSGSGKSTISQLLIRLYEPTEGHILIDNIPLQDLDTEWLRSNVTLVEQTSSLFNGSVSYNIALGRQDYENVTRAEVMNAAEFALLQLIINDMPEGVDTQIGFNGSSMSGGERQRIALARARLRDTPILILDEPTSALDHISRTLMMEAVRRWRQGKTTIIITHDISQIRPADYIYMIEEGKLVQEGYRAYMEKMKDSPFQDFLFEKQPTNISSEDGRITGEHNLGVSSIGASAETLHNSAYELDPLENTLTVTEEREVKPTSFLPDPIAEGTPVLGTTYGTPGSASAFYGPPWVRFAASPAVDWSYPTWKTLNPMDDVQIPLTDTAALSQTLSTRRSHILDILVNQTGRCAADARLRYPARSQGRRKARDSIAIHLTGPKTSQEAPRTDTDSVMPQKLNSLKQIFQTLGPALERTSKVYLVLGFWSATVHAVACPAFSYVLSLLLATYSIPGGDNGKALKYSMVILAIAAVNGLHTWAFRFFHEYVSQLWVDQIRYEAFEHIIDQSTDFFEHEESSVSTLMGSLNHNAEEMRNLLGRFASLAYVASVMTAVSLLWAMSAQWRMTLICISLAPVIFAITRMYGSISEKWESRSNDASEIAAAILTEALTNIKTVKALTLESHFLKHYVKATEDSLRVGFQRAFYAGFLYGLSDSVDGFGVALVFYVGARLAEDSTKVNDIVQVFTILIFLIGAITGILGFIPQVGSSKDSAARLLRLTKLPKDSHEHVGDTRITSVGDVTFDKLVFSYPRRPGIIILKGIDLRLQTGTTTAIVGSSGSGKSTITKLLLDLYSTTLVPGNHIGNLTFGGRDIRHISTASLRSLVIPVPQTPTLFAATMAENIAYGLTLDSPDRRAQSIETAARQAGIHDFIMSLPSSYNTLVGDGGLRLSGGQMQRVAIARALVRKPSVLILDEATSALDIESANLVRHTIKELIKNQRHAMTVIIITHHRDMMEIAERIVVLEQGSIAEEGSFSELMAKNGSLARMLSGGEWECRSNQELPTGRERQSGSGREPNGVEGQDKGLA